MRQRSGRLNLAAAAVVAVVAFTPFAGRAQMGAASGEWRSHGGDTGNTRYSPLDQIHATNFGMLTVAWRFKTDNLGPRPEYYFQSTPVMANGVVYSTGGARRAVVALDAQTGEILWVHREDEGQRGAVAPRQLSGRGLTYWTDGQQERIVYVTPGYQLVALDARTGFRIPSFGVDGRVDLKENNDQIIDPLSREIGLHAAPVVARDTVIVGAAHRAGGNPTSKTNVKGYIRGFDVRTGKRKWIFHTIPQPGELGNDTWLNDSWSYTGNAGVWAQITVDEELGIVYLPVESATGDYFGADRPGSNLFAESLVAVDLETGVRKWHFQLIHHGIWDHDIPCPPILVDLRRDGKIVKAIAQPTKQAFMYVFDRVTGQPLWPIEERPVPKGDVPGEWYSPTQPFPLDARGRPFSYDAQGFTVEDVIDFTPELRAEGLKVVSRYKLGPIFTPPVVSRPEGPWGTLTMASAAGGTVWPGGSYDPETNIVYVNSHRISSVLGLVPQRDPKNDLAYVAGNAGSLPGREGGPAPADGAKPDPLLMGGVGGPGGGVTVRGLPIMKPPYGSISAIDLRRGEMIWQVAHGETPEFVRDHPDLRGVTLPRTGRPGIVGSLTTKTLLISGEAGFGPTPSGARGAMLRAYDKATGKEVGAVYMPAPQTGTPMTYMVNGRQYIVVAVSGTGYSGELIAFRLP